MADCAVVVAFARPGPLGITLEALPDGLVVTADAQDRGLIGRRLVSLDGECCLGLGLAEAIDRLGRMRLPFVAGFGCAESDWQTEKRPSLPETDPPPELMCPITHAGFQLPARMPSGHLYELAAILRWWGLHGTDPLTRAELKLDRPPSIDREVRSQAAGWRRRIKMRYLGRIQRARLAGEGGREGLIEAALAVDPRCMRLHGEHIQMAVERGGGRLGEARAGAVEAARAELADQRLVELLDRWGDVWPMEELLGKVPEAEPRLARTETMVAGAAVLTGLAMLSRPAAVRGAVGWLAGAAVGGGVLAGASVLYVYSNGAIARAAAQAQEHMQTAYLDGLKDAAVALTWHARSLVSDETAAHGQLSPLGSGLGAAGTVGVAYDALGS